MEPREALARIRSLVEGGGGPAAPGDARGLIEGGLAESVLRLVREGLGEAPPRCTRGLPVAQLHQVLREAGYPHPEALTDIQLEKLLAGTQPSILDDA
ncbi:hypothetical protein [Methylobacterium nigriterrae]|uniref:hypothetical protein n=1 Tax=Methylobacterium nigriterrae TaxID=3127512 RepID=UPI0030137D81